MTPWLNWLAHYLAVYSLMQRYALEAFDTPEHMKVLKPSAKIFYLPARSDAA